MRVYDKNTVLTDLEGGHCASYEVVRTRSVDHVELCVHKLGVKRSGEDRPLVQLFDFLIVGNSVLVLDRASSGDHLALKEHGFRQCGLT